MVWSTNYFSPYLTAIGLLNLSNHGFASLLQMLEMSRTVFCASFTVLQHVSMKHWWSMQLNQQGVSVKKCPFLRLDSSINVSAFIGQSVHLRKWVLTHENLRWNEYYSATGLLFTPSITLPQQANIATPLKLQILENLEKTPYNLYIITYYLEAVTLTKLYKQNTGTANTGS